MKTVTSSYFKTHFSELIGQLNDNEVIAITYGKNKEIVGYFSSESSIKKKRTLGILEGKAKFIFGDDFEMTTEEF